MLIWSPAISSAIRYGLAFSGLAASLGGCAPPGGELVPSPQAPLPAVLGDYTLVGSRRGPADSVGYWGTYQTDTGYSTVRVRVVVVSRVSDDRGLHRTLEKAAEKMRSPGGSSGKVRWEVWAERPDSIHTALAMASAGGSAAALAHFGAASWQFFSGNGGSAADLRRFVSAYLDALVEAGLAGVRVHHSSFRWY